MAKAKLLLLGCLKLFSEVCLSSKSGNGSVRTRDNISSPTITCKVYKVYVEYSNGEEEEEYVCEHQEAVSNFIQYSGNRPTATTFGGITIPTTYINTVTKLSKINKGFMDAYDDAISSGNAVISFPNAKSEDNEILVTSEAIIHNNRNNPPSKYDSNRRLVQNSGTNTLIVVRVNGKNGVVTSSTKELSRRFFGGYDDLVNLSSQMAACSFNKLKITPGTGPGIVKGVLDINLDVNVIDTESNVLANMAIAKAVEDHDLDLHNDFDIMIFCLPPESRHNSRAFIAYSMMNGKRAVFRDEHCTHISPQMHEVGHLIGLGHSGLLETKEVYGDTSCYMSYNWAGDETPKRCYNAAKSYELGWYEDKSLTITHPIQKNYKEYSLSAKLSGIVDYKRAVAGKYFVIIKIQHQTITDKYICITLNRQKDFNEGTSKSMNEVTIVESSGPAKQSWLLTSLKSGETYVLQNFFDPSKEESLAIHVASISLNENANAIDFADIKIGTPCSKDSDCDDSNRCNGEEICSSGVCLKKSMKLPCDEHDDDDDIISSCSDKKGCTHRFGFIDMKSTQVMTSETLSIDIPEDHKKHNITWYVNNKKGGHSNIGHIINGMYTAPSKISKNYKIVRVTASYYINTDYYYGRVSLKVIRKTKADKKKRRNRRRRGRGKKKKLQSNHAIRNMLEIV